MSSLSNPFPTVDISPFLTSNPDPQALTNTATALSAACANPGFFYLTNHNLPPTLTNNVINLAREFFLTASPTEKDAIKRKEVGVDDGDGARGYQLMGDNITDGKRDYQEAIDWYRPVKVGEPYTVHNSDGNKSTSYSTDRTPPYPLLHGLNAWPSSPASLRPIYEDYIAHMLTLGTAIVRAMGMALGDGMEDVFLRNTRESWWVMRAIGYPPLPDKTSTANEANGDDGGVSCGAHSDYGCVALLLTDETPGALQAWVTNTDNPNPTETAEPAGQWINVDPIPGALVVNIGDMMSRWSGGRWKATRHRVVHRGDGYRVSVPFFFEPDWEARVPGIEGKGEVVYGKYLEGKVRGNF